MTGPSHIALGVSSVWLLRLVPGVVGSLSVTDGSSPGLVVGAAILGSLLPDLDAAHSTVKYLKLGARFQPFRPLAHVLSAQFMHRGPLHSLAGLGLLWLWLGLPTLVWIGWQPSLSLALGMVSHLVGDASTKSGVPLLYPRPGRWHLLPVGWRLTIGSAAEQTVFACLLIPVFLLLFGLLFQS